MLRERRRHANFKPNRKLDGKSSRGMIYENEELRLRTININAEVERGQSDIKKLRRENYQLRKEIWSLRDEYDRLGKLLKTNNRSVDDRRDDSGYKYGYDYKDSDPCCSCLSNDDNISCDICHANEHCTNQINVLATQNENKLDKLQKTISGISAASIPKSQRNDKIDINFDHLSIVSEECLSNNEDQTETQPNENSKKRPIDGTDITEFQSTIPPLEHFENLSYRDIGPNMDTLIQNEIDTGNEAFRVPQVGISLPEAEPIITPVISNEKASVPKFLSFAPLKSKRKLMSKWAENQNERPDVCVDNVLATEKQRVATIRKPHKPLKCPIYSNVTSDNETEFSDNVSQDMRNMSVDANELRLQQNLNDENADVNRSSDSDLSHPYRTEMSLVLSYNGNQSKYSTSNSNDSDLEPSLSLPSAMKLLPNRLVYTTAKNRLENDPEPQLLQHDIRKDNGNNSTNTENNTNEVILSPPIITFERAETDWTKYSSENIHNELYGNTSDVDKIKKTNENKSSNIANSIDAIQNSDENNDDDYEEKRKSDLKDQNKCGRRVSIQFNDKSLQKQHETMPSNSNDCDANCTDCDIEEPIAITSTSFRLRRASCNRKFSDESFGSLLHPPSSFFGYKRGKKSFFSSAFGPRRHSDIGLIPSHQSQHYSEHNVSSKNYNCHNCHRTHDHHRHKMDASAGPCGANNINNPIDGSTGTSMCNSFASSRESSTSLSQRSISKRKLSITSHTQNGKIPWCACWGNGCI